jgi:hypothetical protein
MSTKVKTRMDESGDESGGESEDASQNESVDERPDESEDESGDKRGDETEDESEDERENSDFHFSIFHPPPSRPFLEQQIAFFTSFHAGKFFSQPGDANHSSILLKKQCSSTFLPLAPFRYINSDVRSFYICPENKILTPYPFNEKNANVEIDEFWMKMRKINSESNSRRVAENVNES